MWVRPFFETTHAEHYLPGTQSRDRAPPDRTGTAEDPAR
jgi:hypothetical protein